MGRNNIRKIFSPRSNVPSGSFVSWANEDDLTHTITSGKKAGYGMYEFLQDGVFNSGDLVEGDSFTFHFSEPGRHEYFCIPHPWMHGVVIVGNDLNSIDPTYESQFPCVNVKIVVYNYYVTGISSVRFRL